MRLHQNLTKEYNPRLHSDLSTKPHFRSVLCYYGFHNNGCAGGFVCINHLIEKHANYTQHTSRVKKFKLQKEAPNNHRATGMMSPTDRSPHSHGSNSLTGPPAQSETKRAKSPHNTQVVKVTIEECCVFICGVQSAY